VTEAQTQLLALAAESLEAAKYLLEGGYPGFAASRAYYAMFYAAEALLDGEGLAFSSHGAVPAAFGQHFARTGRLPARFHRALIQAFETRHKGDYDYADRVSSEEAGVQVGAAEEFVKAAEDHCR
jgi:uncharacterized protein (UPF0332 family)